MKKKWFYPAAVLLLLMMMATPTYAVSFDISPSRPDIPTVEIPPDPNDPDSPERITITENGVPRTYIKRRNPDGTYSYILEEDIPLAAMDRGVTSPQTSDDSKDTAAWLALVSGLGAVTLLPIARKKKDC